MVKPYGCHSKPRSEGYWASDRVTTVDVGAEIGVALWPLAKWIQDTMSQECQYRKSTPDQRCEGCTCP